MKINFLLPHLKPAGGVSVSMTFAHKLAERGHRVIAAIENKRFLSRVFRNRFLYRHPLLPRGSKLKLKMVESFSDLPDADVWVADSWKSARKLYDIKTRGIKFQYVQHDERMYHGDPATVEEVFKLPLKRFVNASWIQRIFRNEFKQETDILFNSVDCDLFNPSKRTRDPDDDNLKVLMLHHDYGWKGTKEGVEVVQNLKKKYPAVKLVLFGTRAKQIEYPCDEYYYNMFGENLARLFANADMFLGPSIDDSRPLPHRWAMASGCALVIYDNVSVDDYAFNGQNCLVAEKGNKDDLSEKLEQVIIDAKLRDKISQNALTFVRNLPTWEEQTDKLERILQGNTEIRKLRPELSSRDPKS